MSLVGQLSVMDFLTQFSGPSFVAFLLIAILWQVLQMGVAYVFKNGTREDELDDKKELEEKISSLQEKITELSAIMQALSPVKLEKLSDLAAQLNIIYQRIINLVGAERVYPDFIEDYPEYYEEGASPETWQKKSYVSPISADENKRQNQTIGEINQLIQTVSDTLESSRILLLDELAPKIEMLIQDFQTLIDAYDQIDDQEKLERFEKEKKSNTRDLTTKVEYIRKKLSDEVKPKM